MLQTFLLTIAISCCFLLVSIYYLNNEIAGNESRATVAAISGAALPLISDSMGDNSNSSKWFWWRKLVDSGQEKVTKQLLLQTKYLSKHVSLLEVKAKKRSKVIQKQFESLLSELYANYSLAKCARITLYLPESSLKRLQPTNNFANLQKWLLNSNSILIRKWDSTYQANFFEDQCDIGEIDEQEALSFAHNATTLVCDQFVSLATLLQSPCSLCSLFTTVRKYPVLLNYPITPLCFALPINFQQFLDVSDALGYSTNWTIEFGDKQRQSRQLIDVFSTVGRTQLIELNHKAQQRVKKVSNDLLYWPSLAEESTVIKQFLPRQSLSWNRKPIQLRLFVLVTSVNPLRAFLYTDGLVLPYESSPTDNDKKPTISQLWTHLQRHFGMDSYVQAQASIHRTLVHTLLLLEVNDRLLDKVDLEQATAKWNRYHLLSFDLVLDRANFQALIVNIEDVNQMVKSTENESFFRDLYLETYRLLFSPIGSSQAILMHLQETMGRLLTEQDYFGLLGINCHISHRICLSQQDLLYILQTQILYNNTRVHKFEMLYPVTGQSADHLEQANIRSLFDQVLVNIDNNRQVKFDYQTERLHSILLLIFANRPLTPSLGDYDQSIGQSLELNQSSPIISCTRDSSQLSHLSQIRIESPDSLALSPSFNPYTTHYIANQSANHWSRLVQIHVEVAHCDAWIQIENQFYLQTGVLNFSLGLGDNQITLKVVLRPGNHILGTYTIGIHRKSREEQYKFALTKPPTNVTICSLVQDCDLKIYPTIACGLQKTLMKFSFDDIESKLWQEMVSSKEDCRDGAEDGRWLVPCGDCGQESSCIWSQAQWMPYSCRHRIPVPDNLLHRCLREQKILLIGDSTNRGIMHYIVERLNGSLLEADKTHDYKTISIAQSATTISFAYYPKFWLPNKDRSSFKEVFHQLIQLDRNSTKNVIVIVGGVQWLSSKHLHFVRHELQSNNITARIIVKTLGSGFHQPVNGVHFLPLEEQRKLATHNQKLIAEARLQQMQVLDTFNKTMALFGDFYPGKCACHFHQIVKVRGEHQTPGAVQYHVSGRLNRLYSEIMLSHLCVGF